MSGNSIFTGKIYHIKLKFTKGGGVENNNLDGENIYIVRAAQS